MNNISKISTFQAIHRGLEKIQKPCSSLTICLVVIASLGSLFLGGENGLSIAFLVLIFGFIPASLLAIILKMFIVSRYMFWAVERVHDAEHWLNEATSYQIVWHPDTLFGRIALGRNRKKFKEIYSERVQSFSDYEAGDSDLSPLYNNDRTREEAFNLFSYKKEHPTRVFYSSKFPKTIAIKFFLIMILPIGYALYHFINGGSVYYLVGALLFYVLFLLSILYESKRFNKKKGVQLEITHSGVYLKLLKNKEKTYKWQHIYQLFIEYSEPGRRTPFHGVSYWIRQHSYKLFINEEKLSGLEWLDISVTKLDKILFDTRDRINHN